MVNGNYAAESASEEVFGAGYGKSYTRSRIRLENNYIVRIGIQFKWIDTSMCLYGQEK
jgi:hypothetical protein